MFQAYRGREPNMGCPKTFEEVVKGIEIKQKLAISVRPPLDKVGRSGRHDHGVGVDVRDGSSSSWENWSESYSAV
jgi:hypothetical protein